MADRLPSQFSRDMERRRFLGMALTSVGGAVLAGCGSRAGAQAAGNSECPVTPVEIRGPFPADGVGGRDRRINVLDLDGILRSDIRPSFAGLQGEAGGVPMQIELELVRSADDCAVLGQHAIYLWQCDAQGEYSLYTRRDVNYLRGLQPCDAGGVARFASIVPGCYGGRAPHLHIEVFNDLAAATSGTAPLLVSQLGLPTEPCEQVYADSATYGDSTANLARWPAEKDWAFRGEDRSHMMLEMVGDAGSGFTARARISI